MKNKSSGSFVNKCPIVIFSELFFSTIEGFVQRGYFVFSFGFLLFRTIAVSTYAAWVNDESKEPMSVLCSVPSSVYNKEVLLLHIGNNGKANV